MKFKIERNELLKGLDIAGKFVPRVAVTEVLENVYIDVATDTVEFSGTNLSEYCRFKTENIEVLEEGNALVPFKLVYDVLKKIPVGEEVEVSKKENHVFFKAGRFKFKCASIPLDDYSVFIGPEIQTELIATLSSEDFIDCINKVKDAAVYDKNTSRPILTGILLERNLDELNFVALDGFRISWATIKNEGDNFSVVIDAQTLSRICKIIDSQKDIELFVSENFTMFKQDNLLIKTPILNGSFFNYRKVFDSTNTSIKIEALSEDLMNAIDRAMIVVSREKNSAIILSITDEEITVSADTDVARIRDKITVSKEGDDLAIAFNANFLFDAIKYQAEKIIIKSGNSPSNPWIITGDGESEGFKTFILPVMLKEDLAKVV